MARRSPKFEIFRSFRAASATYRQHGDGIPSMDLFIENILKRRHPRLDIIGAALLEATDHPGFSEDFDDTSRSSLVITS